MACAQSLGVFGLCQMYAFVSYVRSRVTAEQFSLMLRFLATVVGGAALLAFAVLTATGSAHLCIFLSHLHSLSYNTMRLHTRTRTRTRTFYYVRVSRAEIAPWTGRFYSLLDPSYAKNYIPIIASVSEHQPTAWASYYFDLQILVFLFPGARLACALLPALSSFADEALKVLFSLLFISGSLLLLHPTERR